MQDDTIRLLAAASFAADRHREQRRKDICASPYINHPLDVAFQLANAGHVRDNDLLIAALLHDTVEDTKTSLAEIAEAFGQRVRSLVAEVTDDRSLDKATRKLRQVDSAPKKSDAAKQLKLADKTCNVRDIDRNSPAGWSDARKLEYLDWAARVVAGCRGINAGLEIAFDHALSEARQRVVAPPLPSSESRTDDATPCDAEP